MSHTGIVKVYCVNMSYSIAYTYNTQFVSSMMRIIVLHPCTKFEVRSPSRSENMTDFQLRLRGLATFRLLNGVTGRLCYGPPSCQFSACYSHSRLRVRNGTQSDGCQCLMPLPYGDRGIIRFDMQHLGEKTCRKLLKFVHLDSKEFTTVRHCQKSDRPKTFKCVP